MKTGRIFVIVLAVIITSAFILPNQIKACGRLITFTGLPGRTSSRYIQQGMTENGYQRSVISTGPAGNTASHSTLITMLN
jgi:hypothetical protein